MERFEVYLYDLPQVKDGASIPTKPSMARAFGNGSDAHDYAAAQKDDFDRIVVIRTLDEEQTLVERFRDGEPGAPDDDS